MPDSGDPVQELAALFGQLVGDFSCDFRSILGGRRFQRHDDLEHVAVLEDRLPRAGA